MINSLERIAALTDLITQMSELNELRDRVREAQLACRKSRRCVDARPGTPRPRRATSLAESGLHVGQ